MKRVEQLLMLLLMLVLVQFALISCRAQAQSMPGCTDPLANNYDPSATVNDGSCTYDPYAVPVLNTTELNEMVSETSGLIFWDGNLWTQNDDTDLHLYGLDPTDGGIERTYELTGTENEDWETMAQDDEYIYMGDVGNNVQGNRSNLHILRVLKSSLLSGNALIDTIWYHYSDQEDFTPLEANTTDFDCEAMIASDDSLYLFTKQWTSARTSVYALPKTPGDYTARKGEQYDFGGLVTGATYLEPFRLVALSGYTGGIIVPFLVLLYDFQDHHFFSGNKRRVSLPLAPLSQVEAITTQNGLDYYITNEALLTYPQKLHQFNLNALLGGYLEGYTGTGELGERMEMQVYPNPAGESITVRVPGHLGRKTFRLIGPGAKVVREGYLDEGSSTLATGDLAPGTYILVVEETGLYGCRILKL